MTELLFRVAVVSAAVSVVLLPLLLASRWQKRYAPHTRRAVWLVIAAVLLVVPLLPKSRAPVQIEVPQRTVTIPVPAPRASQTVMVPVQPAMAEKFDQSVETVEPTAPQRTLEWGAVLTALWLTGGLAVLIWQGAHYLLARKRLLKTAAPLTGYEELAKELCPGRAVRFFRVDGLDTPMTLGVLRPVVLLPDQNVRQAALRHELTHIRRWDVAWKYLLLLACAVHWFNPLVWVMSRRADRDMEASCDAAVVAGGNAAERRAYGELLLQTAAGHSIPFTTQFGGGKKLMKARLYDLFHPGKKSRVLVGVVLLVCLLAGSLVACRQTAEDALQTFQDSVRYENGVISFTIPKDYSPVEDWSVHISGRAETNGLGGISLHYLDDEQWEAGKTYTLEITEEQWEDITELTMDVELLPSKVIGNRDLPADGFVIDLLALAGRIAQEDGAVQTNSQVPDGVYCAPMPDLMVERTDNEHWSFTLMKYDPETGARGQILGTYTLPLAEKLTLQHMGKDALNVEGEVGSDGRTRYISTFLMWPLLRAQAYPNMADMLEVRVQDGVVTCLRWFQVPITDDPLNFDPQDPNTWPADDPDFDPADPMTWPDDGGGALEEVPKWYWWGPYCENKKYGFSLRLPASWRDTYWADGEEDLTSFFCDALSEEEGALQKLIVQNKPLTEEELTDRHRLLGETEGCYVYLYSPKVELDTFLSWSEETQALYKTMYCDMEALPEEALTWWDGYVAYIHPITGESSRGPTDEAVLERILRGE